MSENVTLTNSKAVKVTNPMFGDKRSRIETTRSMGTKVMFYTMPMLVVGGFLDARNMIICLSIISNSRIFFGVYPHEN